MPMERTMIIHFNDGTSLRLGFPEQVTSEELVPVRLERMLGKEVLMVEADDSLIMIPFESIKYLQIYPAPAALPDYVIKAATVQG